MKLSQAKEYLPFVQAAAEGKTIQYRHGSFGDWCDCDDCGIGVDWFNEGDSEMGREFRIKPEPKLRPWKPEEVPDNCWLRNKKSRGSVRCLVVAVGPCITTVDNEVRKYSFQQVFENAEHSTDGGKTWKRCGVEE